jgi:hypothetical protein
MTPRSPQLLHDLPEGYPDRLSIPTLLREQAERASGSEAITAPGRVPLMFGRLWSHIESVAGALRAAGIGRNDRVALVLPNGPEMASAFVSVSTAATAAPLNPRVLSAGSAGKGCYRAIRSRDAGHRSGSRTRRAGARAVSRGRRRSRSIRSPRYRTGRPGRGGTGGTGGRCSRAPHLRHNRSAPRSSR